MKKLLLLVAVLGLVGCGGREDRARLAVHSAATAALEVTHFQRAALPEKSDEAEARFFAASSEARKFYTPESETAAALAAIETEIRSLPAYHGNVAQLEARAQQLAAQFTPRQP